MGQSFESASCIPNPGGLRARGLWQQEKEQELSVLVVVVGHWVTSTRGALTYSETERQDAMESNEKNLSFAQIGQFLHWLQWG